MGRFLDTLRTGSWLTRQRMRLWGFAVLAASAAGLLFLVATSDGLNDFRNRPLGTDFASFYAAGTYVLDGHPQAPFDPPSHYARQQAIFGPATPYYGWPYPPFFLFIPAALALMPYGLALAAWQTVTLALYLLAMRAILAASAPSPLRGEGRGEGDRLWLLLALAYPAVFVNLGHGQNGFLTAALLGGALAVLDRRPVVAGILFGLLVYKPQFGLMIPVALVASGRWRTIAAAAATVAALALATLAAFGPDVWRAFLPSAEFSRVVLLEAGNAGWHKLQSVFAGVRAWGGSISLAYAVHAAMTVAVAAALIRLWRSSARYALKAAALLIATILAAPLSHDYDLMVLAPAMAFVAADGIAHGFTSYEKTILAALWLVPLVTRMLAEYTLIPLGAIAMLVMMVMVLRRAGSERGVIAAEFPRAAR